MKKSTSYLSLVILILVLTSSNCLANYYSITINGVQYYNGQTVYIDCTLSGEIAFRTDRTPIDNSNIPGARYWSTTGNYSVRSALGTPSGGGSEAFFYLQLSTDGSDGSINIQFWEGNTAITVYVTRKPTLTLNSTPTLCSSGQSGDHSATLNFSGPTQSNIKWQTTGGLTVNGSSSYTEYNNTNSQVSIQHNSFGTYSVWAEIPGCNNLQTSPITRYVGVPSGNDITFTRTGGSDPGFALCSGQTFNFQSSIALPASQYSYNWSIPQGSNSVSYFQSYGPNATVGTGSAGGGFVLQMNITNLACNTVGSTSRTFGIQNCGGYFRVAENPTSNTLLALFESTDDTKYLPHTLRLMHEKAGVVKEVKIRGKYSNEDAKTGLQVGMDVYTLPKDIYYLQGLYDDGQIQSVRVIVQ